MKKILWFSLLALICDSSMLFSQGESRASNGANAIYAELFGPGMTVSVNYDRRFTNSNKGLGMRIGLGGFKNSDNDLLSLPIGINYLMGNGSSLFEIGINAIYSSRGFWPLEPEIIDPGERDTKRTFGMLTLGYRRQAIDRGFNFRASLNPAFGEDLEGEIFFWPFYGGVSFGYSF